MEAVYKIKNKTLTVGECARLYQRGVSRSSFAVVAKDIARVPEKEMADVCHISQRSISRMKDDQNLPPQSAEIVISVLQTYFRAVQVFGSEEMAHSWLKTPLQVLNGKTPLQAVSNRFEAELVMNILGRIEYGVFS